MIIRGQSLFNMKIVMDFRKFDGVVGGVEKGVVRITEYVVGKGHQVIMLSKRNRISDVKKIFEKVPNLTFIPLPVTTHSISFKNAWMDSVDIQDIAEREKADVIHFPYNWSFPFRKRIPSILTIHDVIPFAFREAMGPCRNLFFYKPGIRKAARLNDVIVTVSEFSKQDIIKKVGVPPEKIKVIPNGLRKPSKPDEAIEKKLRSRLNLKNSFTPPLRAGLSDIAGAGFILNVGGIHERKNIVRLVRAFSKLVNQHRYPGKLLITGSISGAPYQIKMKNLCDAAVKEAGMEERIVFTGFISDEELDTLLMCADFLIYPSLYEGFGIPILEAMQVGTPVITSNITGTREVAGDAAVLIDPYDVDKMAEEMSRLLVDKKLREELSRKGKERAGSYSWERTAEEYLELYGELSSRSLKNLLKSVKSPSVPL